MTITQEEPLFSAMPAGPSVKLRVEIIRDLEGFLAIEADWNLLLARSSADTLFLTYEWISTCWAHIEHARQLFIVVVRHGSAIVAIIPLMIIKVEGLRQLCMIDLKHVSDYKDFIIDDSVDREQVIREIFNAIDIDTGWDFFMLDSFRVDSVNFRALDSVLAQYPSGRVLRKEHAPPALYLPLEGRTFEEYFKRLKRGFRESTVQFQEELERKAFSYDFSYEIHFSNISETINKIIDLNAVRYGGEGSVCVFDNPLIRSFFINFAKKAYLRDWLRVSTLFINGDDASRLFGCQYMGKYYSIIACYRQKYSDYSPGRLLNIRLIKRYFDIGLNEFDMLTGTETYKFKYKTKIREKHKVFLFRSGLKGYFTRLWIFRAWYLRKLCWWRRPGWLRIVNAVVETGKKVSPTEASQ